MSVIISGMSGFLGRNLKEQLIKTNIDYIELLGKNDCNLINVYETFTKFKESKASTALLMAGAVGGIGLNSAKPFDLMSKNLIINKNSIDACVHAGVKRIILIGTICSYPEIPLRIPFCEEDIYFGQSDYSNRPYGYAKLCMMEYLAAAKREYDINYTVLLTANMYGKYDDFSTEGNHVIPALIRRISQAKNDRWDEVPCWGTGNCSRDFLHVSDACSAIIKTIQMEDLPEVMNIGTGQEQSINFTANLISDILEYRGYLSWDHSKPDGQPRRVLNIDKAKKYLNWEPKISLKEGLEDTIDWFLKEQSNGP